MEGGKCTCEISYLIYGMGSSEAGRGAFLSHMVMPEKLTEGHPRLGPAGFLYT